MQDTIRGWAKRLGCTTTKVRELKRKGKLVATGTKVAREPGQVGRAAEFYEGDEASCREAASENCKRRNVA